MKTLKLKCPDCDATIILEVDLIDGEIHIVRSYHAS